MRASVEADVGDGSVRRPDGPTGQPRCHERSELRRGHRRDGRVERRQRGHRFERLDVVPACCRPRAPAPARSGSSSRHRACTRRRRRCRSLECGRARGGAVPGARRRDRPLGAPPRGRRHDAARHVRDRPTVYGLDPNPGVRLRYHRLRCGDWWDGDPASPTYNRFRHVACGAEPPFRGGSEALWRATRSPTASSRSSSTTPTRSSPAAGRRSSCTTTPAAQRTAASASPGAGSSESSGASDRERRSRSLHNSHLLCILIQSGQPLRSSAPPATSGRRRSTALLAHPELDVIALGSDCLAGEPAGSLDPRLNGALPTFVPNVEAGLERRRRDLPLPRPRRGRGVRAAGRRGRGRPVGRAPARRSRARAQPGTA